MLTLANIKPKLIRERGYNKSECMAVECHLREFCNTSIPAFFKIIAILIQGGIEGFWAEC